MRWSWVGRRCCFVRCVGDMSADVLPNRFVPKICRFQKVERCIEVSPWSVSYLEWELQLVLFFGHKSSRLGYHFDTKEMGVKSSHISFSFALFLAWFSIVSLREIFAEHAWNTSTTGCGFILTVCENSSCMLFFSIVFFITSSGLIRLWRH